MLQNILMGVLMHILTSGHPVPQYQGVGSSTLACVAFAANEVQLGGRHIFVCGDAITGELEGAVLRRNGSVQCALSGAIDVSRGCAVIFGCGLSRSTC